jgi:hypothetical protein
MRPASDAENKDPARRDFPSGNLSKEGGRPAREFRIAPRPFRPANRAAGTDAPPSRISNRAWRIRPRRSPISITRIAECQRAWFRTDRETASGRDPPESLPLPHDPLRGEGGGQPPRAGPRRREPWFAGRAHDPRMPVGRNGIPVYLTAVGAMASRPTWFLPKAALGRRRGTNPAGRPIDKCLR